MSFSDPIADMLTCIRNAQAAGSTVVEVPHSKLKAEIVRILKREGYVSDYGVEGGVKKSVRVYLKYTVGHKPVIQGLTRVSTPGLHRYVRSDAVPKVLGGMGVVILSTSQGLMTDKEARKQHVGGEVLCKVW